jgi:trk system potassium uptake protein TrkH
MSFRGIVSAMAACLFNIGPGFAEIGPTRNFAGLHAYTQVFLSFLMILGRLELFALLVLFSPSLWKRF